MARYRKKPVVIEAVRFIGITDDKPVFEGETPPWLTRAMEDRKVRTVSAGGLVVVTREGSMGMVAGEWIIKGVVGELYPCGAEIFDMTYEPEEA